MVRSTPRDFGDLGFSIVQGSQHDVALWNRSESLRIRPVRVSEFLRVGLLGLETEGNGRGVWEKFLGSAEACCRSDSDCLAALGISDGISDEFKRTQLRGRMWAETKFCWSLRIFEEMLQYWSGGYERLLKMLPGCWNSLIYFWQRGFWSLIDEMSLSKEVLQQLRSSLQQTHSFWSVNTSGGC